MAYNAGLKRYKSSQKYQKYKYNQLANTTTSINKKLIKRGGIKL